MHYKHPIRTALPLTLVTVDQAIVQYIAIYSTAVPHPSPNTTLTFLFPHSQIRMTIINNMLTYHPEAAEFLVEGQHLDMPGDHESGENPLGMRVDAKVKTKVTVGKATGARSKVEVTTTDRPGLLVDIVRTMKDLSLNVISAEIDTIGPKAYDVIYCTYQGAPLSPSMEELVKNALTYYLCRREVESAESY